MRRKILIPAVLLLVLQLEGCYYMQAIRGHSDLMGRRRPVAEVINDGESSEDLRTKLEVVSEARDFAVTDLLLPDNDSYRSYADLERDYVVWNVFAAPEFSLEPKRWCYPVAGCVAYRGYFSEDRAEKLSNTLSGKGYDVAVGGVSAYSTLGRFADPVLNTMMHWSDAELVSTMFHELAHQKLYIKGDSEFNESFASAVAAIGMERWLETRNEADRLAALQDRKALRSEMMALVNVAKDELAALYAGPLDEDAKRRLKRERLDRLSADADALIRASDPAASNWLAAPLNNARLVSLTLYAGRLDAFRSILENCGGDLACFYGESERLADLPSDERSDALDRLIAGNSLEMRR